MVLESASERVPVDVMVEAPEEIPLSRLFTAVRRGRAWRKEPVNETTSPSTVVSWPLMEETADSISETLRLVGTADVSPKRARRATLVSCIVAT